MYMFYCLYLLAAYGLAASAAQSKSNGCILPEYPPHGIYTVHDRPEAVPGQTLKLAILTVTCDPGFGVVGNNSTYCFSNNVWQQPMPQCTRFCSLPPDPSVKYLCKVTGDGILSGTRKCREMEPNGTEVVPECNRPVYYFSGVLLNMRCFEGTWDHIAVCQPDCGTSLAKGEELIINGTRAKHGDLPWHAAIYDKTYTPYMQVCGGSLVSNKAIISAAHCFWNDADKQLPASRYAVALGKIYRPWDDPMDVGAHKSEVKEIKMPARFIGPAGNYQHDIALVIMETPVVYVDYIRPVCLDLDNEFDRNQLQSSNKGRVSGWGLTSSDGVESPVLLTAELPFVDVNKCLDDLAYEYRPYVTGDKICAGAKDGTTVCKGDSGGGLVFPNVDRGTRRYFLRGIVSTAPTSSGHKCNANTFTTFTHILPHATFITDHGLGLVSVRDGPVRVGGCVLPDYPPHGTYTVHNRPEAVPGQVYDKIYLTVTCDPGYRVVDTNFAFCSSDNKWSEPKPQCSRFCQLTPHPSVKYHCKEVGDTSNNTRLCNEYEPSGTVAVPICNRPNYYHPGNITDMHCDAGFWDHVTICQPECGITKVEPNTDGLARLGEVPWHAGIYDKNYSPFGQTCGGSLVSTTIVISAAHCFWKGAERLQSPSRYVVALGKIHRPWNDPMDPGAHKSDVSDIKVPIRFRGQQTLFKDDIALLVLSTPVVYNSNIRPICVDFSVEFDRSQLQGTDSGKAAGWGLTSEDGVPSPVLKTMELKYVDEETCIDHLPLEFISSFTSDKICVNPVKGVVCRGDAGGGVAFPTVDSQGTQRYYLRGVVSLAPKNDHLCNVKADILLTHVVKHEEFIKKHLNNNFV